ncbi:hypothetical protein [Streptomyces sp. NPDC050564]|uniref:hypothetical protein n=1 Tax=Streptomyces sp. NPDC050564 TaxID=3365631 RepID=UPI0037B86478
MTGRLPVGRSCCWAIRRRAAVAARAVGGNEATAAAEEGFGPVATLIRVEENALHIANNVDA